VAAIFGPSEGRWRFFEAGDCSGWAAQGESHDFTQEYSRMPSRRELIQLTPEEIAAYLASSKTIILVSTGPDGYPHPMPMWFHVDAGGVVRCTTFARSQKVLNLQRHPKAALLVESGEEYAELKGVLIYARADVVEDTDAVVDALVKINSRGRKVTADERDKLTAAVRGTAAKRVLLKFTPERYVSWDHAKLGGRY
jgi:nitroimidazol reductase NimA-like FMN-containing flavoprotein (pyridoxamine 5'-phosphate oxidase superfamily)